MRALGQGLAKDERAAKASLESLCRAQYALACGMLGSLTGAGMLGPKDVARAVQLFELGCEGKDALSCESLGGLYAGLNGQIPPDMKRAIVWYETVSYTHLTLPTNREV